MSDEIRTDKDRSSEHPFKPVPDSIPTAVFVRAMDEMRALHQKQSEERHKANSAQQKTVGMISLEQLKLSDRMQALAAAQVNHEEKLQRLETKLDTVIELAQANGSSSLTAASKAEAAAVISKKTYRDQLLAIGGAVATILFYLVDHFAKK